MTTNQVAYWNMQESKRHNLAGESIQREANKIKRDTLSMQLEMLPYQKAKSVTGSIADILGSAGSAAKGASSVASLFV